MKASLQCRLTSWKCLLQVYLINLIEDFLFYWSHRILHTPWMYKRVHKKHHEFDHPVAFMSHYAHWFEYIFASLLPSKISTVLLINDLHIITYFLYFLFSNARVIYYHCGYDIPYLPLSFPIFGSKLISHEQPSSFPSRSQHRKLLR